MKQKIVDYSINRLKRVKISLNYKFMLKFGTIAALLNMLLNVIIAWLIWQNEEVVLLWGQLSMASFMFTSGAIAGFILCFIATKATRVVLGKRKALPLHWHLKSQTLIDRLPTGILYRSFMLALSGVLFVCIVLFLFDVEGKSELLLHEFLVFISIQAALLGGGVTVVAFYRALGDETFIKTKVTA